MKQNRIITLGLEEEAEKLRMKGLSVRKIAQELSKIAGERITHSTVWRYFNDNRDAVNRAVKQRVEVVERAVNQRLDVIEQLKEINDAARSILATALAEGEYNVAVKAMKRIQEQLELQAKLLGDIATEPELIIVRWQDEDEDDSNSV